MKKSIIALSTCLIVVMFAGCDNTSKSMQSEQIQEVSSKVSQAFEEIVSSSISSSSPSLSPAESKEESSSSPSLSPTESKEESASSQNLLSVESKDENSSSKNILSDESQETHTQPNSTGHSKEEALDLVEKKYAADVRENLLVNTINDNVYVVKLAYYNGSGLFVTANAHLVVNGEIVESLIDDNGDTNENFWNNVNSYY